ncbi:MAG: glycoside hydrolase family 65 protein, partial [Persicimonas sp.]
MEDEHWKLVYEEYDPDKRGLREAICALGNGYFCTRGAFAEEEADQTHYPGTYIAGGYDRQTTRIAGRDVENEDLVNFPNWLSLTFRIDGGPWFDLDEVEVLDYRLELDIARGVLRRRVRFRDASDRTTRLRERRFVHIDREHLAGLRVDVAAEDWSGRLEVRSAVDGRVENDGVERYSDLESRHHEPIVMEEVDDETLLLKVRTLQSRLEVALAQRTRAYHRSQHLRPERTVIEEPTGLIGHHFEVDLHESSDVTIEKTVALFTSRDPAISEAGLAAKNRLAHLDKRFDALESEHALAWELLWRRFDIAMDVESAAEPFHPALILRLHVFHLLQTSSPNTQDLDVGVPARGWHGEAYRGHIFWDELFIFPLLNLRMPEITRSLLKYRYRRLDAARREARQAGFEGAMFPWQSGSSGREESQVVHLNPESGRWLP